MYVTWGYSCTACTVYDLSTAVLETVHAAEYTDES